MSLKSKYGLFNKIIEQNSEALKSLSSIREYENEEKDYLIKNFSQAMKHIKKMAEYCTKLNPSIKLNPLLKKIKQIEDNAFKPVNSLQTAINMGYQESEVLKELEEDLFEKVERLTKDMRDSSSEKFELKNTKTPHDLIRYFHQKGLESMFNMKSLKKLHHDKFIQIPMGDNQPISVIDLEGKLAKQDLENLDLEKLTYKPLKAILELYNSKDFQKSGDEEFKAIVSNEKLVTMIELGCHYSELEATIGRENKIKFVFRDTDFESYENAKYRSKYVRTVLTKLGFQVNSHRNETKAEWNGEDEQKAYKTLQEVVRLAASTADLDLGESHIDKYQNKAVNAFFKGITDIGSYLEECYDENKKDDKKIKF